jgi:hypothetical protein
MSIGYRQKEASGPLYHPERDFAYITPTLLRQAIENLEAPLNEEIKRWVELNDVTQAELIAAAEALADAQRDFVSGADPVTSLEHALNRRDWQALRYPVRQYVLATIGEVIIGAWFKAVREVTEVGEESPAQNEMCRFSSTVREFAARSGAPIIDSNSTAETLLFKNDVLRTRLAAVYGQLRDATSRNLELEAKILRLEVSGPDPWWKRVWRKLNKQTDWFGPR